VSFTSVRRGGLDPDEVRQHLDAVAREMGRLETRINELTDRLAAADRRAAEPKPLDESSLSEALGEQSASILRAAHEEAAAVTAEVQTRAERLFAESQARSAQHLIEAKERALALVAEAEESAETLERDAREGAERLIDSAKKNADALIDNAREKGRAIVEQSHEARRAVLNDLAVKRKALHLQIDQLRAARDVLMRAVSAVRGQVDEVLGGVFTSDEQAKSAALEILKGRVEAPEPSEEELLAGTPLRAVPDHNVSSPEVTLPAPRPLGDAKPKARKAKPATDVDPETLLEDDPTATDVVNDIFARLRKATLEERGAQPATPRRAPAAPRTAPSNEVFERRDDALDEALALTIKRVKRALQDDQNAVLESLRDVRGMITTELGDEKAQRQRYADAALEGLTVAAQAGVSFAKGEGAGGARTPSNSDLAEVAADFAVTIVLALRKRILTEGEGDASSRANDAFREWRGARVERLCTDSARRAFHLGVLAAVGDGNIRFLVAPNDAPCDACALDAGAPERAAGTSFPSGSLCPPLHAGCACTVVPA
jgi:cell division septum initiation protein DivIVA